MCAWYVHVFSARMERVHTRISKLKPDLQARLRVYLSLFPSSSCEVIVTRDSLVHLLKTEPDYVGEIIFSSQPRWDWALKLGWNSERWRWTHVPRITHARVRLNFEKKSRSGWRLQWVKTNTGLTWNFLVQPLPNLIPKA